MHGEYSINELAFELAHFFDPQTVRNVELSALQEAIRQDWKSFGKDF